VIHHYYSHILKFAIVILNFPQICHRICMKTTRAQLYVYTKTHISLYLRSSLNDMRVPLCQHPLPPPIFYLPFPFLFLRGAGQAARAGEVRPPKIREERRGPVGIGFSSVRSGLLPGTEQSARPLACCLWRAAAGVVCRELPARDLRA
jgi:hypothetical protein